MFDLEIGQHAQGTPIEVLQKLIGASGLVITVRSSHALRDTVGAISAVAPRLLEDHDVRADGLIMSRVGGYRVFWGAVVCPSGSLAVLVPLSGYDGQDITDWVGHFRREVLDPVGTLSNSGYSIGGGGNGSVTDSGFAQEFPHAYV